jgi:hypothetical protein
MTEVLDGHVIVPRSAARVTCLSAVRLSMLNSNCSVPMKHSNGVNIDCTDTVKMLNLAYFVLEKEYYV